MQTLVELRWIVRAGWDGPEKVLQFFDGEEWEDVPTIDTTCLVQSEERDSVVSIAMKDDVV